MRTAYLSALCVFLAGCTLQSAGENYFVLDRSPNTAPRGSEAFCDTYGRQTAINRLQSSDYDGRGPNGFDRQRAKREGERAYRRCLSGRTN